MRWAWQSARAWFEYRGVREFWREGWLTPGRRRASPELKQAVELERLLQEVVFVTAPVAQVGAHQRDGRAPTIAAGELECEFLPALAFDADVREHQLRLELAVELPGIIHVRTSHAGVSGALEDEADDAADCRFRIDRRTRPAPG